MEATFANIDDMYPTIGFHNPGSVADANFGQKPFLYNIFLEAEVRLR